MDADRTPRPLRGIGVSGGPAHAAVELRLSGMPIRMVAFGLAMFVTGSILMAVWGADVADPNTLSSWHVLGLTHVFALGFITSVIIAVLYQFIPANFHANVQGVRRAQWMSVAYMIAVTVFAVSLLTGAADVAALAGPLLAIAVALFLTQMFSVVIRAKRRTAEGGFHIAAFFSLSVVIVLGALLATSLPTAWLGDPRRLLTLKITLAVGGWLGCILLGISYHTIRGLNGSSVRGKLVKPTLACIVGGLAVTALVVLVEGPAWLATSAMTLVFLGACLFTIDAIRIVRGRAANAGAVTWRGQLLSCVILLTVAAEGALAPVAGETWLAMAVSGFLVGVAPSAILANGNRIVPVLVANRFMGRGRTPLSQSPMGRITIPVAQLLVALAWVAEQWGIGDGNGIGVRVSGLLLTLASAVVGATIGRQMLSARRESRKPMWQTE